MTYDHWKANDGAQQDNLPDERLTEQCDCCGEYKPDCETTRTGLITCQECLGVEDDDDYGARADWEYDRNR